MSVIVSNLDSVIFAIPLLGLLFSAYFRINEQGRKPVKTVMHRSQMPGLDLNGIPLCPDPDGTFPRRGRI